MIEQQTTAVLTPEHQALLSEAAALVQEYGSACTKYGMNSRAEYGGASARTAFRNAAEDVLIRWISAQTAVIFTLQSELAAALHSTQPGASVLEAARGALGWHRLAEHLMGLGDIRQTAGERVAASWCFAQASDCECQALAMISVEHARTRQIIADSMLACDVHAQELRSDGGN